ncbi:MAG: hypothetical protein ACMUJM_24425 [bacterium]
MNTSKIKAYAPQARRDFIQAVVERANLYGIFDDKKILPLDAKGDVALIGERAFSIKEGQLREALLSRVKKEGSSTSWRPVPIHGLTVLLRCGIWSCMIIWSMGIAS